jgi:hypothetical protein
MDFLFHLQLLIGVIAQSYSAETDLVESTTVQQLWAGVTTKKLILDIFSIRPNCQPRVSRSSRHTQVMLQTVTLFYIHCGSEQKRLEQTTARLLLDMPINHQNDTKSGAGSFWAFLRQSLSFTPELISLMYFGIIT